MPKLLSCIGGSPSRVASAALLGLALAALVLPGCGSRRLETKPAAPAGPIYTGPTYLRGTVASLGTLRNSGSIPVSGFGLVVGLDGTGHRGAPIYVRQQMLNEMRKRGVGSIKMRDILPLTPAQVLDSTDTAVVMVEGLIPRGATAGTRFDLLVTALDGTQTTSLAGGTLYTTDLAIGGADPANRYSHPLAAGSGPIYMNPFGAGVEAEDLEGFRRQAIIVAGGRVTKDRKIEIVLNQPSWQRARLVEDRINERFPMLAGDRAHKTANATSNQLIEIEIPSRYADRPDELLALISNFYVNNSAGFEEMQGRRLYQELQRDPEKAADVTLAWKALGKTVIPVLREGYEDARHDIRMAALEAGAYLKDERASKFLLELAGHDDPAVRAQVAESLVHLPRSMRGGRALKQLLDDEETSVRVTAYESLARIGDPIVERMAVQNEAGVKFVIDRVPSQRPLVYVTYYQFPRIVIFDQNLGFDETDVARLWNNRLMIRRPETLAEAMVGLKAGRTVYVPVHGRGEVKEIGSPKWRTTVYDSEARSVELEIDSRDLHDRFLQLVGDPSPDPQAVIVAQLMPDHFDENGKRSAKRLTLLELRDADTVRPLTVYYRSPDQRTGRTYKITPTVATFTFLLAAKPTIEAEHDGLDLSYSEVVDALYHLCMAGHIEAPIQVDTTPMAALIARRETAPDMGGGRPETGEEPEFAPIEAPGGDAEPQPEVRPVTEGRPESAAKAGPAPSTAAR